MSRITHFDIPSDDPIRAQKFYSEVFGWKFEKWDGPTDYWIVTTGIKEPGINGGNIRHYFLVTKVLNMFKQIR